jgi:hypothetical protein
VQAVQAGNAPPGVDAASQRVRAFAAVMPRQAELASAPEMQVGLASDKKVKVHS